MPVDGPQYPVNLVLGGKRVLVVGGGQVAARKVAGLLACGAVVHVIAEHLSEEVRKLGVTFDERSYASGDLNGFWLVVTATSSADVNRSIFEEGERAGIWVNAADEPASCSFTLPSVVRRGSLVVTISTGGHSPALATWLKQRLQREIGPEYETLLGLLSEERSRVKAAGVSTEDLDWSGALDSDLLDLVKQGRLVEASDRLRSFLTS